MGSSVVGSTKLGCGSLATMRTKQAITNDFRACASSRSKRVMIVVITCFSLRTRVQSSMLPVQGRYRANAKTSVRLRRVRLGARRSWVPKMQWTSLDAYLLSDGVLQDVSSKPSETLGLWLRILQHILCKHKTQADVRTGHAPITVFYVSLVRWESNAGYQIQHAWRG